MPGKYVLAKDADLFIERDVSGQVKEFQITGFVETVSQGSTMKPYGISRILSTGTTAITINLEPPVAGSEKTIILQSTAANAGEVSVFLGSGITVGGNAAHSYITFSTLATEYQALRLVGLTTALWAVVGVASTVGGFGVATGIRSSSVASS
jgi:hypothetical protein